MYSRHELVWLNAAGWQAARAAAAPGQDAPLARWQHEDWPAVVRRSDASVADDIVCLGVALPPDADGAKCRIALQASTACVSRSMRALPLFDAAAAAPAAWQDGLRALAADAHGLALRAYGSLALQACTGLPYLRPSSDIDLLLYPRSAGELHTGLALLAAHSRQLPLDGEVVFPSGAAVAWKEWLGAGRPGARVLVKHSGAVCLARPEALLASLAP